MKNVTISDIWFQEVSVMLEEKIENAWMSKSAWAGEKACPFWNSRRRWYQKEKQFDVYFSDVWVVVWYFALRLRLPFCHSMENWCVRAISCIGLESPPPTHIPYLSNTIIPHPYNAKKRTKWLIDTRAKILCDWKTGLIIWWWECYQTVS